MFSIDTWSEIFISIRKNWVRTILSGFTVALGLFIFVTLFGIGNGLKNGFMGQFIDDATNVIFIGTGRTSKAYGGFQEGREVEFKNDQFDLINEDYDEDVQYSTARIYDNVTAKFENEYGSYSVRAVHPDHRYLENTKMIAGRYINPSDVKNKEKIAVIGRLVEQDLFKRTSAVGEYINIDGVNFKIVGVFTDEGGDNEERIIYIPVSTHQMLNKGTEVIDQINLGYNPEYQPSQALAFGENLEKDLKKRLNIHPDDTSAIWVRNNAENLKQTFAFLWVLSLIVLFIGGGTLIAGVVGIGNIMIYIVKERTKEIGVRKALGAKPGQIVRMILQESVFITLVSGIIGVAGAIWLLNSLGDSLKDFFIVDPGVGMGTILTAFFILIGAGILAGFIPATRAANIKPIEALRDE